MSSSTSALALRRGAAAAVLVGLVVACSVLVGVLGVPSWTLSSSTSTDTADGVLPAGVTVFDDRYAAIAKLDPALLGALRRATRDAADDGVHLYVNSGWRSREYQERLLDEAVARYGSRAEAARWVATPATSPHVAGDAVDIGHADADAWLSEHGARYGLCRIYRNEPWHYELRPGAVDHGCPSMYADAAHDPRTAAGTHADDAGRDARGRLIQPPAA